jgi:hypothetical protein
MLFAVVSIVPFFYQSSESHCLHCYYLHGVCSSCYTLKASGGRKAPQPPRVGKRDNKVCLQGGFFEVQRKSV